jgi:3-oxoacyl-(acyl-carrier-protein) synthase
MTAACVSAWSSSFANRVYKCPWHGYTLNDSAEAAAINRWAGDYAERIPVSSTKASVGHTLGAAGAVEAVVCLMALAEQWLPPTITLKTKDPGCEFPVVQQATSASFEYA